MTPSLHKKCFSFMIGWKVIEEPYVTFYRHPENVDGNPKVNAQVSLEKVAVKIGTSLFDTSVSSLSTVCIYLGEKTKLILQEMLLKGRMCGGESDLVFTYSSHTFQLQSEYHN